MNSIIINYKKNKDINYKINISGSKSESNRLLIIKKLFNKKNNIKLLNLSNSRDTKIMIKNLNSKKKLLNIKDAGTVMRFLISYFVIKKNSNIILTGSSRMKKRPIFNLVESLKKIGAKIKYKNKIGYPPIKIKSSKIKKNKIYINTNISSQYITSLLLISYKLKKGLKIYLKDKITSLSYIDMTIKILKKLKINVKKKKKIIIKYKKKLNIKKYFIESDWSSASYYYSIISLLNNITFILTSFKKKSLQGDNIIYKIYNEYFGVNTKFNKNKIIIKKNKNFKYPKYIKINLKSTPDIAQTIILTCSELKIKCFLKGLKTLNIKETNRLKALKKELKKNGTITKIDSESIKIIKFKKIKKKNIFIKTYKDHRMAMSFSILAINNKNVIIENPNTVNKSYPNFWKDLKKIGFIKKLIYKKFFFFKKKI
ncbi:MAG: 3-phosphoshikimate 1-carboxyvinyltransferase [Candidatus Shikimatogenerans bostrichidophilus]|nr:MAG: 3-phosphoshikimate 1-carboxyvinyltransferase [Candidatus Shikimatogenerans bostrichidophilus]